MSSHFDSAGNAHLVNVTAKAITTRTAIASGVVTMQAETATVIRDAAVAKGDVLGVARIAAIQATKLTQQLIPLCHAIPIEAASIRFDWPQPCQLRCIAEVQTTAKTGVEMEALTAVSVACLTIYDMVKSIDRGLVIGPIRLEQKSGGRSGTYSRDD